MKRALASLASIVTMASVVLGSGSSPCSYLDTKKWQNIDYGPYRRIKSRTKQWEGHDQKALPIRRKHNKAAKQARKIQRRRVHL